MGLVGVDNNILHSTGFINYTSVLTDRLYFWVCQMVHETSSQIINIQYIFYQWSKPDLRITVTLATPNSSMLIISVSENFLVESEWLFTK
jgi:hypothetical protein